MRIGFWAAAGSATPARTSSAIRCRYQFMMPPLSSGLFQFDVGFLGHAAPLHDLAADERRELGGRGGNGVEPGAGEALFHVRLGERGVERLRELRHRLRRRAGGGEHALEAACIYPRETGLLERRYVGKRR